MRKRQTAPVCYNSNGSMTIINKTLLTKANPERTTMRAADYKAAIAEILAEMGRLNEQIRTTQAETDRVRAKAVKSWHG